MATLELPPKQFQEDQEQDQAFEEMLTCLPTETGCIGLPLYQYQGFWCHKTELRAIISLQKQFQGRDSDMVIATVPRSGTIWLKALAFALVNRKRFKDLDSTHPLLHFNPHELVPTLEYQLLKSGIEGIGTWKENGNEKDKDVPTPRLVGTHMAYACLPERVKNNKSKILYLCRNPLDNFVSGWHLASDYNSDTYPNAGPVLMDEAFEKYCEGIILQGPYWEHMLEYWKESLERPEKVLFMKYEDMKEDSVSCLKRVAEFLGFPFSGEEEREGVVREILRMCSFERMSECERKRVSEKKDICGWGGNVKLLRKGEVGDWVNHLTLAMAERLSKIMEHKLAGSGLEFKMI